EWRAIVVNSLPARVVRRAAHHLIGGETEDALGAGVAGNDVAVGVEQSDTVLHSGDDGAIACLAFAQLLDCHRVFGDVTESSYASSQSTLRRLERPRIHTDQNSIRNPCVPDE